MFVINWSNRAFKQAKKLAPDVRIKIGEAVTSLENFPTVPNIKALINHKCSYRLRVGNYRVLFDVETEVRIIEIQEVKKRDDQIY
jgi:mRNA-degrading endonuclease RelE of RelBE toxin-antitoxin system